MSDIKVKQWEGHFGEVVDSLDEFDVIDCSICGFKHVVPMPSPQDLLKIYKEEYYCKDKPLFLDNVRRDFEWSNISYRERYDTFEEQFQPGLYSVLDVGSGPGYFLLFGKERGWQTLGIEPSKQAAAYSRSLGLEIIEGFFPETMADFTGFFDVVHMAHVLEHVPDPKKMLQVSYKLLKPGGLICIIVPNDYNPLQKAFVSISDHHSWWVSPVHHINYFDFTSIKQLLESCGYEVFLSEATFPIDMFLLMGDNYLNEDSIGKKCHMKRKMFEESLIKAGLSKLKRQLYASFAECGLGRGCILYARKKGGEV